jgi:hypothetical protein
VGRAGRERRVHAGREVGRGQYATEGRHDGPGHLHAADLSGELGADPAAAAARLDHVAYGRVDLHAAILQSRGLAVHGCERGPQHVAGHAVGRIQDHVEGLAVVVGEALVARERASAWSGAARCWRAGPPRGSPPSSHTQNRLAATRRGSNPGQRLKLRQLPERLLDRLLSARDDSLELRDHLLR